MGTMLAELPLGQPIPCSVSADEEGLDLHGALVPHPTCSFYMRVSGHGLRSHGIHDGDLLVIDRSVEPRSGDVVIVAHRGVFLLRPLRCEGEQWLLEPQRAGEGVIVLDLESFDRSGLFGVVAHAVHHLARSPSRRR
jgi:DNA polymerase V